MLYGEIPVGTVKTKEKIILNKGGSYCLRRFLKRVPTVLRKLSTLSLDTTGGAGRCVLPDMIRVSLMFVLPEIRALPEICVFGKF